MSVISVHLGQCGTQVGQTLYSQVFADLQTDLRRTGVTKSANQQYVNGVTSKWFAIDRRGKLDARAILVDADCKVAAGEGGGYRFRHVICKPLGGSGNNWALGYHDKSKLLIQDVMNGVREEAERCDDLESFLGVLGTGGGSGSGVGSKILQSIRSEFPKKNVVNALVLPYRGGDVATQSYNTLLTFAKTYECTNASVVYQNDALHQTCANQLCLKRTTLKSINSLLVHQLLGLLQPMKNTIWQPLAAHPKYRIIQTKSAPLISESHSKFELNDTWARLCNSLSGALKGTCTTLYDVRYGEVSIQPQCIGNILVTRGGSTPKVDELKVLKDPELYVKWVPEDERLRTYHQPRRLGGSGMTATLAFNGNKICEVVSSFLGDAWTLYTSRAYVHHYKKYGVDEECFLEAFEEVKSILDDYRYM